MAIPIQNGLAADEMSVDSVDKAAHVRLSPTALQAGYARVVGQVSAESDPGGATVRPIDVAPDFRLRVGQEGLLFNQSFEGAVIPQAIVQQDLATMTAVQTGGYLVLNAGNSVASGVRALVQTYRSFCLYGSYSTYFEFWLKLSNAEVANCAIEFGVGVVAGASVVSDGVFFRINQSADARGVISFNGTETQSITFTIPTNNDCHHFVIGWHNDQAEFWQNDQLLARIPTPAGQAAPSQSQAGRMFVRLNQTGVPSLAKQVQIGFLTVSQGDSDGDKPFSHRMCGMGLGGYQVQHGTASGQSANWVNSAAPASATLSNTAAGYTTSGGQYQFAATATNETDWALFGWTNPAGSASLPGKTFYCTGIRVGEMHVTGVAAVNATMFFWAVGVGSTAVSLATTDGAATLARRVTPLGSQAFLAAAPLGTTAVGFERNFSGAPKLVPPGTFLHIILKQLNGAATASLVFRGTIAVEGYFE